MARNQFHSLKDRTIEKYQWISEVERKENCAQNSLIQVPDAAVTNLFWFVQDASVPLLKLKPHISEALYAQENENS